MVNFHPLVLGIIARWGNKLCLAIIFIFLGTGILPGQDSDPLTEKERRKFNEVFFKAEKEKNLGNTEEALELYQELYKLTSFNATVCYEMARIYANDGQSDDAIFYAERAAELSPENKWYQLLLSRIYGNFSMPGKQVEVMQNLVALDSTNPDYRYELAMAHLQNSQPHEAIAQLDELESFLGVNEAISDKKKEIYLDLGELENAAIELERLIKAFPRNLDYYGSLAQLYRANGLNEEAFDIYEKMLEINDDDPRVHLDLAQYYRDIGNLDTSIYHLKRAIASPALDIDQKVPVLLSMFDASANDSLLRQQAYQMLESVIAVHHENPKAYAIYGDFLSRDGRNQEALKAYKKAVQLEGGNRFKIWEQILLIEAQSERYDSLAVDASAAVELYPNQPLPYLFAGMAYSMLGDAFEAVGYLEDGLNYVLGNARLKEQFYTQLASAYHELGEHEKSDANFEKALALNDQNPTVLNNFAYYLSVRGQKLDRALEMTKKSNRLEENNPVFMDTWAWVLYKQGNYAEALAKMEQLLKLGVGNNGEVLEHYGDILYKNGRVTEAIEQWKRARSTGMASDNIDQKINREKLVE